MAVRRESKDETYDVIVIGSGMAGLAAAGLLAKAGKKVLVIERHDRPGGCAHGFQRGKYKFDSAVHVTSGCEPLSFGEGTMIHDLLSVLGVRDLCTFLPINPFYAAIYPGFRLDPPTGIAEFIDAHAQHWPKEKNGMRQLLRLHARVNREAHRLPSDISSYESVRLPEEYPLHYQYRDATLGQVMDEYLTDPRLKTVFSTLWSYQGLPPSRVSFVKWSSMFLSFIHTGVYYSKGGFQKLPDALVAGLEKHGGEILLRSPVRRILVKDRKVTGVMLEHGQRIQAPIVVSNADATQTFEELVGPEHLPRQYVKNLRQLRPSLSAVAAYMATNLDLRQMGAEHENFIYKSWDHDETYDAMVEGRPYHVMMSVPSLADPSLAPPGEHVLSAITLIPYNLVESWREEKGRYVERLRSRSKRCSPGSATTSRSSRAHHPGRWSGSR
jgi:phytoene dehydrogenase-like protein